MKKTNNFSNTIIILLFFVVVLFVYLSVVLLTGNIMQESPKTSPGYADLSSFNFDEKIAHISHRSFLYYKNELLSPEDIEFGRTIQQPLSLLDEDTRFNPGNYGTYKILLTLPANGATYGISSYSAMYSQRLFINRQEYKAFGTPGNTTEATIPKTGHYTYYFTPKTDRTELIIQFANFDHADYGGIVPINIGLQYKMTQRNFIAQKRVNIIVGSSMTVFLLFFGMFLFLRRRRVFLWFSFTSLSIALRTMIVNEKIIMLLLPFLSWHVSLALEYLSLTSLLFSFLMYTNEMFKGALHKYAIWIYGFICSIFAVIVLFTKPIFYTNYTLWFLISSAIFGIYTAVFVVCNFAFKKDNQKVENVLVLVGMIVFIILSIIDIQIHRSGGSNLALGLTDLGMIVLIFANMQALIVQYTKTEAELDKARQYQEDIEKHNQMLDSLIQMKSKLMADISHEVRTPLTVMSSYAGLTALQLRQGIADEKTLDNLSIIKCEAVRLANIVEQLKETSVEKERQITLSEYSLDVMLQEVVEYCEPICLENKNKLIIEQNSYDIFLFINRDRIFQVFINLIVNANRHTKKGTIKLNASMDTRCKDNYVKISVTDDGEGIEPNILNEVFKRGVSGDGGTGLGLNICKEIIEEHGGGIWIDSEIGKGTKVNFTLPIKDTR